MNNKNSKDDLINRGQVIHQLSLNKDKRDDEWKYAVENDIQTVWKISPVQSIFNVTKANCLMHFHKEYGCDLIKAEEAYNKALEYLRSQSRMIG